MCPNNAHEDIDGLRYSETVKKGYIRGLTFPIKEVEYAEINGEAVFEGCIVLGTVEEMEELRAFVDGNGGPEVAKDLEGFGIIRTGQRFRWPKGILPYDIDPNLPDTHRVTDAIAHWTDRTDFQFVERTAANAGDFPDYVTFRPAAGCSSRVGRSGGQQFIDLGPNCTTGNTIHEIGHTIGLWHEQSREDRENFIEILWENIIDSTLHNFQQHISDGDDVGGYDYGSIMHYPAKAFSKNGKPTIAAKNGAHIGQRDGLSAGDIATVNEVYAEEFAKRD
jgi:astacin